MLQKLSEQIQSCFDRSLDAKRKADETADPARKADFLEMEKRWLALAQSYDFTRRLTDFTAANADWRRRFDERVRAGERPDDARRLQKMIQEVDVDALFERMWLASIVEHSDDVIIKQKSPWHYHKLEQGCGAALWLFGRGGHRQAGDHPGAAGASV
jgi:hypothetical protein